MDYWTLVDRVSISTTDSTVTLYGGRKFSQYPGSYLGVMFYPGGSSYARPLGLIPLSIFLSNYQKLEYSFLANYTTMHYIDITYKSDTECICKSSISGIIWLFVCALAK